MTGNLFFLNDHNNALSVVKEIFVFLIFDGKKRGNSIVNQPAFDEVNGILTKYKVLKA